MRNTDFEAVFLGTNGSVAYNNGNRTKYGTNTVSVAVRVGGETLVFDTGTGLCSLSTLPDFQTHTTRILYSHYHIDHICGLLFYSEMFNPDKRFDFYGSDFNNMSVRSVLDNFLKLPLHPVGLSAFKSKLSFNTVIPDSIIEFENGVLVHTCTLSHPGSSIGYRVEYASKSFCYITDIELANHKDDKALALLANKTDLLVIDSFFGDDNYIPGWGHSTWQQCAAFAKKVKAKQLALFHFMPIMTDAEIDTIEQKAKNIFSHTFCAYDSQRITL